MAAGRSVGEAAREALLPTALGMVVGAAKDMLPPAVGLGLVIGAGALWGAREVLSPHQASINRPGECLEVKDHLVAGKTNVVVFSAPWCPACRQEEPRLKEMCQADPDKVVLKVDIKDWDSPVAKQYDIHSLPHFQIYDQQGQKLHEGDRARAEFDQWCSQLGI